MPWSCLYTHHLTQKNKRWQDGSVMQASSGRVVLYDVQGTVVDSAFVRDISLGEGVEFQLERHMVMVEHLLTNDDNDNDNDNNDNDHVPPPPNRTQRDVLHHPSDMRACGEWPERSVAQIVALLCPSQENDTKGSKRPRTTPQPLNETRQQVALHFPTKKECSTLMSSGTLPRRRVCIPDTFTSVEHYTDAFAAALTEDVNLQLLELGYRFFGCGTWQTTTEAPRCGHGSAARLCTVRKEGSNQGRQFYACGVQKGGCGFFSWVDSPPQLLEKQKTTGETGIRTFRCDIIRSCRGNKRKKFFQRRARGRGRGLSDDSGDDSDNNKRVFLKFLDPMRREQSSRLSKDDLWIVSTGNSFEASEDCGRVFLVRSVFHGVSSSGLMEVLPFSVPHRLRHGQRVFALHGPNVSSEVAMLDTLSNLKLTTFPLLRHILSGPVGVGPSRFPVLACARTVADHIATRFSLNDDQRRVLESCASWFKGSDTRSVPVILVHGVFGSGKSYLLVALVVFLATLLDEAGIPDIQVLVAAATNVAVDRVLLGLLAAGFENFMRVGSLRRIAKEVLPKSVHGTMHNNAEKEARHELQGMLDESLSPHERQGVVQALHDLDNGLMRRKIDMLRSVRVVGVTCAATTFPVLGPCRFPIVLLDECSQIVEPASLLPTARFGCERLIAVGDPLQLPPPLVGWENGTDSSDTSTSLGKTLFVRLSSIGYTPTILCRQYRCHPILSRLANRLFYGGALEDGVSESERAPVAEGLAALSVIDVPNGMESVDAGGSFRNEAEASVIASVLRHLLERGVEGEQIGVIYRAQTDVVRTHVARLLGVDSSTARRGRVCGIQISTVDAFQGAEKEIILLSCCRTTVLGFLESSRRLNVALTRARRHLVIVGLVRVLRDNAQWATLIDVAQSIPGGLQSCQSIEFICDKGD